VKPWRLITHNWTHKLASLAAAVLIWAVTVNAQNPIESLEVDVPVDITCGPDFSVRVEQGIATVHAVLRGERLLLQPLRDGRRKLVATVRLPDPLEEGRRQGQAILAPLSGRVRVVSLSPPTLTYRLTRLDRKMVKVQTELRGTPIEGVDFSGIVCQPPEVEVVGPKSVVDAVESVRTIVRHIDLVNQDTVESKVRPIDAQGRTLDDPELTVMRPTVVVSLPPVEPKTVRVSVATVGRIPDGYRVAGIEVSPEEVPVRGQPGVLERLTEIQTAPLDITNLRESARVSLSLRPPEGVTPLDVSSVDVRVTIARVRR